MADLLSVPLENLEGMTNRKWLESVKCEKCTGLLIEP